MILSIRLAAFAATMLFSADWAYSKSPNDPAILKRFRAEIARAGLYPTSHPDIKDCLKWEMEPLGKDSLLIKATSGSDRSCQEEVYFDDHWITPRRLGTFVLVAGNDGERRTPLQKVSETCNSVTFRKRIKKMEGVLMSSVLDKLSAEIPSPGGTVTIPASMVVIRYFDCVQEDIEAFENGPLMDALLNGGRPKEKSP